MALTSSVKNLPASTSVSMSTVSYKTRVGQFSATKDSGVLNVTEGVGKILGGAADAKTTPFGDGCMCLVHSKEK